ncbi:MAG: dihydropteroate synthase [Hyphomicrobiaceae bacterium]|nr:dihydropteroate synthase [Hyphomicrobiaceae bacterium]
MITRSYIRPVGRMTRPPGRVNITPDKVIRIGDREDLVFGALELLQRHSDGSVDTRVITPSEARHEIARGGSTGEHLKAALAGFANPRPPIAGVSVDRPRIMGVVNVTPDSFSDGGSFSSVRDAISFARRLDEEGADFLDIGGESTRPGSDPVPVDEELRRVMPVIDGLVGKVRARLSIDTRKSEVMRRAALAGVHVLNDVSALSHDANSLRVAAETRLPVILMHARGDPKTMQRSPHYDNVLLDVFDLLASRVEICQRAGIPRERIIVDPGIGFGKTVEHNAELLAGASLFHGLGTTLMIGSSRKSFIAKLTGALDPSERLPGSLAGALAGIHQGAAIVRVHDVAQTRQAVIVWEAATRGQTAAG